MPSDANATIRTMTDAIDYVMHTRRTRVTKRGLDEYSRNPSHTRHLLQRANLPAMTERYYCVITGSKGKGSTAAMTAKLFQALGYPTGLITSPHMRNWNERIRLNGQAIPEEDFVRIVAQLKPMIDEYLGTLSDDQYLSPQGLFLLIASQWWDEQGVEVAILEVGRGGRFDDMSVVNNAVSVFTPIFKEHAQYLGNSLTRIAWHKAGIISPHSRAYSVLQVREVATILDTEARAQQSDLIVLDDTAIGRYLDDTAHGVRFELAPFGIIDLPFYARHQIQNASVALRVVADCHRELQNRTALTAEERNKLARGLAEVRWYGRLQKLQDAPAVYVDGAINVRSARDFISSLRQRLTAPLVIVMAVPIDRDVEGVYRVYAQAADHLIITENHIHPYIHFPDKIASLALARHYHPDVAHRLILPDAMTLAYEKAGESGTILLGVAQPLVGEALIMWDIEMGQI